MTGFRICGFGKEGKSLRAEARILITCRMKRCLIVALIFGSRSFFAAGAEDWGSYPDRPLELRDLVPPDGRRFSLIHQFNYIDPKKQKWEAPTNLIVDGA